jgi:hypothetical protein
MGEEIHVIPLTSMQILKRIIWTREKLHEYDVAIRISKTRTPHF